MSAPFCWRLRMKIEFPTSKLVLGPIQKRGCKSLSILFSFCTQNLPLWSSAVAGKHFHFLNSQRQCFLLVFVSGTLLPTLQSRTAISFTMFSSALLTNAYNEFKRIFQTLGTLLPEKKLSINGVRRQGHQQTETAEESQKLGHISWQTIYISFWWYHQVSRSEEMFLLTSTGQLSSSRRKIYHSQSLPDQMKNLNSWKGWQISSP